MVSSFISNNVSRQRPPLIWAILIIYCLGLIFSFGAFALVVQISCLTNHPPSVPPVVMGVEICALILRGIGVTRLYFLKEDAWIYMGCGFLISLIILLTNQIEGFMMRLPANCVFPAFIATGFSALVILYAYRIGNPQMSEIRERVR